MTARCNTFDFILGLLQVGSTEDGVNTTAWLPEVTKIQKRFSGNYNLFNEYWVPAVRIQVGKENWSRQLLIILLYYDFFNSYTAFTYQSTVKFYL